MSTKKSIGIAERPIDHDDSAYVWNTDVDPDEIRRASAKMGVLEQMFVHLVAMGSEELELDHNVFFYGATIILGEARKLLDAIDGFYDYARTTLPRRRLTDAEKKMLQA